MDGGTGFSAVTLHVISRLMKLMNDIMFCHYPHFINDKPATCWSQRGTSGNGCMTQTHGLSSKFDPKF